MASQVHGLVWMCAGIIALQFHCITATPYYQVCQSVKGVKGVSKVHIVKGFAKGGAIYLSLYLIPTRHNGPHLLQTL